MDDKVFDHKSALSWIDMIESDIAKVREQDIYPKLNAWISQASASNILEIGCGQGACSNRIDGTYTGIEPSQYLIDRAILLYSGPNRKFLLGNAYDLPVSNSSFDAVFSISVWHLLSDLLLAAKELSRVLKNEGHFLIITANPDAHSVWTVCIEYFV
jgi:SAM-dependent methyltransferase